jgi:hypothetical protein
VRIATRVLVACLSLLPGPALAVDWSLSSTLSQTFELNDNMFMRTFPPGGTLGSYTNVTANALALTPTSRFTLDGNVGYQKFWGPGTEGPQGIAQTESNSVGVNAYYETWGKNHDDKDWLNGSFRQSSTLVAVLGDLGVATNAHGNIDRTMVGGGIQRSLSAMDLVSVSATSTLTTYDPASSGTEFTDSSVTGTWRHQVSPLTTVSATSQFEWLNYDTMPASNLMLLRETAGFETALSPLLTYGASLGVIYSDAQVGAGSPLGPLLIAAPSSTAALTPGSTVGFIGDAHAIYRILKDTTLNLFASQSVAPSVIGTLTKRTTLHAGLTQIINSRSSVSVAGEASQQTSSGTTNDFLSGSVSYSYQLAREWNASLTYRYLHRTATSGNALLDPVTGLPILGTGPASSNSIMAVVSKQTTIIPLEN